MMRSGFVLLLCFALTGCALTARPGAPHHYTLAVTEPTPVRAAAPRTGASLQVARIDVPAWLAGTQMYYRLHYRGDDGLAAYTQSDWAAPPGGLLQRVLRRTLAREGDFRAVVGSNTPAHTMFSLYVRLDDFSQAFASPQESAGVLDATAVLLAGADGRVVAQRHFHVEVAARAPDAAGGVAALAAASREFARHVGVWLARLVPPAAATGRSSP